MSKLEFLKLTFDEQLEAAWNFHNIEKAVFEREVAELKAENEKLLSRVEKAEEAYVCLDSAMNRLQEVFRVNMRKWFSSMSREEIDAEIAAAIRETE